MRSPKTEKARANATIIKYVIQRGDTIYSLARKFKTTPERIAEINNLHLPSLIFPGDVILLEER
ncbi:MAG: LysM peptidoglycan-binding domain-containing protein [Syntrophothermus sp.]